MFGVKQCLNDILLLKSYSNEIKSLSFVYSHSAPVISSSFNLKGEIQTGLVRDLNGAKKKKSPLCSLQHSRVAKVFNLTMHGITTLILPDTLPMLT
jgi:hypothetical protein